MSRTGAVVGRRHGIVGGNDPGAFDFVGGFVVVGNPQFRRIARGEPEIIIAAGRHGEIAADAFAVVVAVIGNAFERAQRVGERSGSGHRNVGDVRAGDAVPDFAYHGTAGVKNLNQHHGSAQSEAVAGGEGNLKVAGQIGNAADHVGGVGKAGRQSADAVANW